MDRDRRHLACRTVLRLSEGHAIRAAILPHDASRAVGVLGTLAVNHQDPTVRQPGCAGETRCPSLRAMVTRVQPPMWSRPQQGLGQLECTGLGLQAGHQSDRQAQSQHPHANHLPIKARKLAILVAKHDDVGFHGEGLAVAAPTAQRRDSPPVPVYVVDQPSAQG